MPDDYSRENFALLAGEISGALSRYFDCELEVDPDGSYTGRTIITRPSGKWAVSVGPLGEAWSLVPLPAPDGRAL